MKMPFVKSSGTILRAVSTTAADIEEYVQKGEQHLLKAREIAAKNTTGTFASASELDTKQEIKLTIQAAQAFRISNKHYDSAKAYGQAASLYAEAMKDPQQAAELYTESAIAMEKVDSEFANEYYRKAISQHCDASQYDKAAILEERMGNNHSKKKHFEASIDDYERASKLYTAANMYDSADRTLDRTAYMLAKSGRIRDSAYTYFSLAKCQAKQNLKKFNVPQTMIRAGLLLLSDCLEQQKLSAELDFLDVRDLLQEMYELDCRFEESREHKFLVDIMHCIVNKDLDKFADCLFWYNSVCEFDEIVLDALEKIKNIIVKQANEEG